jgi:hypothetical protein
MTMALQAGMTRSTMVRAASGTSRSSAVRVVAFRDNDPRQKLARTFNKGAKTLERKADQSVRKNGNAKQAQKGLRKVAEGEDYDNEDGYGNPASYTALSAGFGLTAASIFALPEEAARIIFQEGYGSVHDYLHDPILKLLAIGLSAASVINWVQKNAAQRGELDEQLHRRLDGALSFFAAGQIFIQGLAFTPLAGQYLGTYGSSLIAPPVAAALGGAAALQWWVAGRNYAKYSPEGTNPTAIIKSFAYDASQTFADLSNGFLPLAYAFLTATFLGAGFGYLLAPYQTLDIIFGGFATKGPEDVLTWQLVGAGISILLGSIGYSLKEAALEGTLEEGRYKALNLGLLTASLGHVAVLGPLLNTPGAGTGLPLLLGAWVGSTAVSLVGLNQRDR